MNTPLKRSDTAIVLPSPVASPSAKILSLGTPKRPPLTERLRSYASAVATRIVPPVVVIALVLAVWEILCRKQGATLPPPSRVIQDTWELIADPFFDRGGIDKGLFWHLSASLQRVAFGYALAASAGVALGTLLGPSGLAVRGLDPIFPVPRPVPPLAL